MSKSGLYTGIGDRGDTHVGRGTTNIEERRIDRSCGYGGRGLSAIGMARALMQDPCARRPCSPYRIISGT